MFQPTARVNHYTRKNFYSAFYSRVKRSPVNFPLLPNRDLTKCKYTWRVVKLDFLENEASKAISLFFRIRLFRAIESPWLLLYREFSSERCITDFAKLIELLETSRSCFKDSRHSRKIQGGVVGAGGPVASEPAA